MSIHSETKTIAKAMTSSAPANRLVFAGSNAQRLPWVNTLSTHSSAKRFARCVQKSLVGRPFASRRRENPSGTAAPLTNRKSGIMTSQVENPNCGCFTWSSHHAGLS